MLWIGGFLALGAGIAAVLAFQPHLRLSRLKAWRFPDYLPARIKANYPHLSDADCQIVIEGLRQYFAVAILANGRGVAMPSQAVDVAWHEFILSTRAYKDFCAGVFGRFLHHTPAEAMAPGRAQRDIRTTWRLACKREAIDPKAPDALPLLFAIDAALNIPDGFTYVLDCSGARAKSAPLGGGEGGAGGAIVYCAADIGCTGGGGGGGDGDDSGVGGCSGGGCGGD